MKKIILSIAFIASGLISSAQVGVGTTEPIVSLQVDRSTDNLQADGVLVPRVTVEQLNAKAGTYVGLQNGALVFITAIAGAANETSNVSAVGFHFYNFATDRWVALSGGAAAPATTASNGLTATSGNITLGGTLAAATTVTQDNNNLTFVTGTARAIVNGTFETQGAVYSNARVESANPLAASNWTATDHILIMTAAATGQFRLPDAQANPGRIVILHNVTGGLRTFSNTDPDVGRFFPLNKPSIANGSSTQAISIGGIWRALN